MIILVNFALWKIDCEIVDLKGLKKWNTKLIEEKPVEKMDATIMLE
jgi:hypothetical protein